MKPFSYDEATQPAAEATPFSYEDASGAKPHGKGFMGQAKDLGLSALKGAIAVPETAVGLADMVSGGQAGKLLENEGGAIGFRPKQAKEFLTGLQTDQLTGQRKQFSEADGIMDKAGVALTNPALIANTVAESVPAMLGGGVVGRGLLAAAPRIGATGAGAIGEGIMGAGASAEQIRQETADGLLTGKQSGLAAATGVTTAGFGALGGKVAQKLGIGDVDTMMAKGALQSGPKPSTKGITRQAIEGAMSEGLLEELPQSVSEQLLQNLALNKPWDDGLDEAIVMGTLAGMAMGGPAAGLSAFSNKPAPDAPPSAPPGTPDPAPAPTPPGLGFNPTAGTSTVFPDGSVILNSESARGEQAVFDKRFAPQPVAKPSEAMGLDANAGALSAAAVVAVDTGAHDTAVLQQNQAIAQASKGKDATENGAPADAAATAPPTTSLTGARPDQMLTSAVNPLLQAARERAQFQQTVDQANANIAATAAKFKASLPGVLPAAENAPIAPADAQAAQSAVTPAPAPKPPAAEAAPAPTPQERLAKINSEIASGANADTGARLTPFQLGVRKAQANQITSQLPQAPADPAQPQAAAPAPTVPMEVSQSIEGAPIDKEWSAFTPESGTLSVPRADMPQIKAEARGAMVNFLKARGIASEAGEVQADSLKPTQAEFSPAKVAQARGFTGGDHSILVSSDGHVLDGHHQWLAKRETGAPVKVIRLDAPIADLLPIVKEFPSAAQAQPAQEAIESVASNPQGATREPQANQAQPQQTRPEASTAAVAGAAGEVVPAGPVQLGRNNQPLSEGGKPYQTRLAASDAKKLQPMMRVISVKGGFVLAEKTEKQLAAEQKAARRLRNPQTSAPGEPIPAHAFIAAEGGLHKDTRPDMNIGANPKVGNRSLFAGKGKGVTMERATARLIEEGYLREGASHSDAAALIKKSLTSPQYNPDGVERMAIADEEARYAAYELEMEEAVAEIESVDVNAFDHLNDDDIPLWDTPSNTTPEAAMAVLGFTEQEIQDEATADRPGNPQADSENGDRSGETATSDAQASDGQRAPAQGQDERLTARPVRSDQIGSTSDKSTLSEYLLDEPNDSAALNITIEFRQPDGSTLRGARNLHIENAVKGGYRVALTRSGPALVNEKMQGWNASDLGAAGMRYANWLSSKESAQEAPGLTAPSQQDVLDQQDRAEAAAKSEKAQRQAADEIAQRERVRKDIARASEAAADSFVLGGDAEQNLSGQGGMFDEPPPAANSIPKAEAKPAKQPNADKMRAEADLMNALADLGDIFSKPFKANLTDEQTQKLMPVLTRVLDAAFRLGYAKFKDAAKFALDQIKVALGADVADAITLAHLQGSYIAMAGGKPGVDTKRAVINIEDKSEIENHVAKTDNERNEESNAPSTDGRVERDSAEPAAESAVGGAVPDDAAGAGAGTADAGGRAGGSTGRGQQDRPGVPFGSAPVARERGDQPVFAGSQPPELAGITAGADFSERGGDSGIEGIPFESTPASEVDAAADQGAAGLKAGIERARADKVPVKLGDLENIRATLPQLLPGQDTDVLAAEARFAKPTGYGMLFTNGTGTGKTFSGLGIIKRFARQGKTGTLIVVPDDKIAADWIESGRVLGLNISKLGNTRDAGKGIVITSYANLGENDALASRQWDLVVADEAHSLMQSADGEVTTYLRNMRAITYHPESVYTRHAMLNRDKITAEKALDSEITSNNTIMAKDDTMDVMVASLRQANARLAPQLAKLRKELDESLAAMKQEVKDRQGATRTRLVALSATPFAYEKTIEWAQGYLFEYKDGYPFNENSTVYNQPSPREYYFQTRFGYSMRYNKLNKPGAGVDTGLMQRMWNGEIKKSGALSGRMLDVAPDYDRRFVLVQSAIGNRIDEALAWLNEQRQNAAKDDAGFGNLAGVISKQFEYLEKRYLLEAIKATEVVPIVKAHMALGRKVVVFHDYKKGGGFNPFKISPAGTSADPTIAGAAAQFNAALVQFNQTFADLVNHPFEKMGSPIDVFSRELPGVLLVNGDEKKADLFKRYKLFQDDSTGPMVMLVQSAKNKGWSGHDTTGKNQRVLINLGQPTAPTLAIQQEGRIYRTGQASDAIMRYLNTGTNWERWTFASTIASRASTAENLGMGEAARALKDSFIQSFEESDTYAPGHEDEGKGGKERDKAANNALSEYDRAKALYAANQKKNSRTKAQEGKDYFATPEPVGLKMVEWLDARSGEDMLEPSGGHGAIARWFPEKTKKTVIEPSLALRSRLALAMNAAEDRIIDGTFEDHAIVNKYDGVAMNPPFGTAGRTAVDHIAKAAEHLRDGGRIVALLPVGSADAKFDKWLNQTGERPAKPLGTHAVFGPLYKGDTLSAGSPLPGNPTTKITLEHIDGSKGGPYFVRAKGVPKDHGINLIAVTGVIPGPRTETYSPGADLHMVASIKLPSVTFERAGTGVMTRIVVLEKQTDPANAPARGVKDMDLTHIESVKELFDRLENITMPKRPKVDAVEAEPAAAAPGQAEKPAKPAKPAPSKVELGATVMLDGKPYTVEIYKTNAGQELRGVWVPTQAQALTFGASTFQKRPLGWFVRERDLPKPDAATAPAFSRPDQDQPITGTAKTVRAALAKRFGLSILQMEKRGFLKIWDTTAQFNESGQSSIQIEGAAQGLWNGKTAHLFADGITPGNEVAVLLHEVGEHASMQKMLGPDAYKRLVARAHELMRADDPTALEAVMRIPDDTPKKFLDSELLAYMIEIVAAQDAKATPSARKWLADVVAAVRAWWSQTGAALKLRDYGIRMELTPKDIAALAVRAVKWQGRQGMQPARGTQTFGQGDTEPMFSRASVIGDTLKATTITDLKAKAGNKLADYRNLGLQFLGGRQLNDLYAKDIPQLPEYTRMVQQMSADANEVGANADQVATSWGKLKDERQLSELMHDATLAQIDPDKPAPVTPATKGREVFAGLHEASEHRKLKARFDALSPDAQKVYRDARDGYSKHFANVRVAIREKVERSAMNSAAKKAMLERMDAEFFGSIKGVYFPLARFGQYVVVTRGPTGDVVNVSRAETLNEANTLRDAMRKAYPGASVGKVLKDKEFNAARDSVGRGFLKDLFGVLDKEGVGAELQDAVNQLYLASMPDLSWAKHGLHRKGTAGFSQDARRAYAQNMFHGARYLAKLRYADQLQDQLTKMEEYIDSKNGDESFDQPRARDVVSEMVKRNDSLMNPKSNPLSTALTSFGFVFHLGLSPASAVVNLSQTALVAYPIMGAKWGFDKAAAALAVAGKQAASNKNDISSALNADERRAYDAAVNAGTIDVTNAHDLAGIAQGEDAGIMWKVRPIMKWASFLFHHAERFNRQITFVASYRLARAAGTAHDAAFEQATKATYDGHFDYAASNRPRFMQGNAAKVLLLFKQYATNMIYTMARQAQLAINAEKPADRREARRALGSLLTMHAAAAGVLGLPMVGTLLAAASMLGGSDDEPWDAEDALRNTLAETFGQKPAEVMARGFSRLTPWDISGRVGLDKLIFPDIQEGLAGQRWAESAMTSALGPVAGIGVNMLKGIQEISGGNYARGLEAMMPAALRGPLKALRYEQDGNVDRSGVVINDQVSVAGVLGQAMGFSPSETRNATEGHSAVFGADKRLGERRAELMGQFAKAYMQQDADATAEARANISRFNEKNPSRRINPVQMMQSVRGRQKRIDESKDGVFLPKNRQDARAAGNFAQAE